MAVMREVCLEIFVVTRAEISDVMTIEVLEIFAVMTTGAPEISAEMKVEETTGVEHHVDKRESEIVGGPERPRDSWRSR